MPRKSIGEQPMTNAERKGTLACCSGLWDTGSPTTAAT